MSDYCAYCQTRRPDGGTDHLVLNGGELWIEFCAPCGAKEILTNADGVTVTVGELFLSVKEGREPNPAPVEAQEEEVDTFHSLANAF